MNHYIKRLLEDDIIENSKSFSVILICGPRQVGKTTILEKLSNNKLNYVSLDDPLERKLAKEDPSLFLENHKTPLIIDEIQYATELLPYIKMRVDKAKLEALNNNTSSFRIILFDRFSNVYYDAKCKRKPSWKSWHY